MYKKILKSLTGILIGGVFLYLTLRNKPISEIIQSLGNSNLFWVIASTIGLLTIFYVRALRWKILLDNNGYETSKYNVVYSLILGYLVNSFTPKLGEIIRCTSLNKYEGVPVSKSFGTVLSERIYDVLVLLLGFAIIVIIEFKHLGNVLSDLNNSLLLLINSYYKISIAIAVLLVIIVIIAYRKAKSHKFAERISNFFKEFIISMKDSFTMKNYRGFIMYTSIIWILLGIIGKRYNLCSYSYFRIIISIVQYNTK